MLISDQMPDGCTHRCKCGTWTKASRIIPNKPADMCCSCYTDTQWTPLRVAVERMSREVLTDGVESTMAVEAKP